MEIERSRQTLQALARDLSSAGERDALVSFYKGEISRTSFRDLGTEVEQRARMLMSKGIGASDPVVLCGPGGADWIIACLAILRCGACVVPVDNQFTAQTFEYVVKDCGARCSLVASSARKRFRASLENTGVEVLPLTVEFGQSVGQDFPRVNPGDRAILCYTSGTTGPPKGVPLSHQNIAFQIDALAKARLVTVGDRVLLPLPLHHVYPLVIGMLTALALGLTLILPDGFTGPRILAALREGKATLIIGVPRLYQALVEGITNQIRRHGSVASLGFRILLGFSRLVRHLLGWQIGKALFAPMHRRFAPSLKTVVSGGAALKPEIARTFEALGWQVATGYGLTETSPMLTINPPGKAKLDTAGQAVPGIELRVEHGADKEGALGEVLARGPGVFAGYHGLPEKTKAAFTADGWFRTGDLGRIDEDGWLHLVGRGSTLIVTQGGENVQPEQIEDAYQAHPAIAELAVFEKDGRIAALIVPNPALVRDGNPEEAVRAAVQEVSQRLPSYQRISEYRLTREAIPRTRLGKPQVHLIADRYQRAATESLFTEVRQETPVGMEDLSADDQALLEDEAANAAFKLLVDRSAGRRVTPDSDLQLDLGIDSIDWLELTFQISERINVTLSEATVAELRTVRDLLVKVAQGGEGGAAPKASLEDPEGMLDDRQRRWLEPKGLPLRVLGRFLAAVNRVAMRVFFRLRVYGIENVPADGPYVLTPNHASYLDPFALAAALSTKQLERLYWAGWTGVVFGGPARNAFARAAQVVPIDPVGATASSLAFGGATLQRGCNLVWFPEGERSPDGRLRPFKLGLGLVLDRWRVPVVPVIIRGTHAAWPRSRRLPLMRPVTVEFLVPVQAGELAATGKGEVNGARIMNSLHRRIADRVQLTPPCKTSDRSSTYRDEY
jgi:long-chain acyl-CoA synthetase